MQCWCAVLLLSHRYLGSLQNAERRKTRCWTPGEGDVEKLMSQRRSMVDTKKSLQTTLSVFLTDLEELSGVYLKITTNIYLLCSGSFEDLFLKSFGFCGSPWSRLGWHFCSERLFGLGMENVVNGVGQSYFTATKSWPNRPSQITTSIFQDISGVCMVVRCHSSHSNVFQVAPVCLKLILLFFMGPIFFYQVQSRGAPCGLVL